MNLEIRGQLTLSQADSSQFSHMISIGDEGSDLTPLKFRNIEPSNHLCLQFRDRKTRDRRDSPTKLHILPLFDWLATAHEIQGLIVHCGAGISRSPAIALLSLCYLRPGGDVFQQMCYVAESTRSNYIWPNPLVLEIGDAILCRNGEISSGVNRWRRTIEPGYAE